MSKRLRILLILSLVLNLFVIGGVVGSAIMWQRAQASRPAAALGRPALRQAAAALAPEYKRQFRKMFRETIATLRPDMQAARKARQDVPALLSAQDLDGQALTAAVRRSREADMRVRVALEARVMTFVASLPTDQRIIFSKELVRVAERQRDKRIAARRAARREEKQ